MSGVVTAIAGPESADATFEGPGTHGKISFGSLVPFSSCSDSEFVSYRVIRMDCDNSATLAGGHAGGMIMADRHDALLASAEFSLAVEAAALRTGHDDTVATVGVLDVEPGAENSIGRFVRASLDVRDTDQARRDTVVSAARAAVHEIGQRRGVNVTFTTRSRDAPATSDAKIVLAIESATKDLGFTHRKLVSRAYHDSLLMARKFPIGMIFVPCRNGVSHHPTEFTSADQIDKGIKTLAASLAILAGGKFESDLEKGHTEL